MKARKVIKITLLSLVSAALLAYMAYAVLFLSGPDSDERCSEVALIVTEDPQARFFGNEEVEALLKDAHVYPKGMLMKDVNTKKVEEAIRRNDFVSKVECYKSTNGKLCIQVDLRTPVIYVIPEGREGYLVDAQGKIISNANYATNLVVASGDIDTKFASTKLAEFGHFLQTDEFWNNQIEQVYVTKNRKGEQVVEANLRAFDAGVIKCSMFNEVIS